jgi:hypothetical protein
MRIIVRGYGDGELRFKDHIALDDVDDAMLDIFRLAESHREKLKPWDCWLIEVEFLDEPDPLQRFLRFGTDKDGMVDPRPLEDVL